MEHNQVAIETSMLDSISSLDISSHYKKLLLKGYLLAIEDFMGLVTYCEPDIGWSGMDVMLAELEILKTTVLERKDHASNL